MTKDTKSKTYDLEERTLEFAKRVKGKPILIAIG
jgi:hypothetical protein